MPGYGVMKIHICGTEQALAKVKASIPASNAARADVDWFLTKWKQRVLQAAPPKFWRRHLLEVVMDDYWDDAWGPTKIILHLSKEIPELSFRAECAINQFGENSKKQSFVICKDSGQGKWYSKTPDLSITDAFLLLGVNTNS